MRKAIFWPMPKSMLMVLLALAAVVDPRCRIFIRRLAGAKNTSTSPSSLYFAPQAR